MQQKLLHSNKVGTDFFKRNIHAMLKVHKMKCKHLSIWKLLNWMECTVVERRKSHVTLLLRIKNSLKTQLNFKDYELRTNEISEIYYCLNEM